MTHRQAASSISVSLRSAAPGTPNVSSQETLRSDLVQIAPSKSKLHWERQYPTVERQTTADGVHVAPFRAGFPLELHAFNCGAPNVRMNRHEYCELMYIYWAPASFRYRTARLKYDQAIWWWSVPRFTTAFIFRRAPE